MGNWGSWKVGDATIDLWTGSEDVYYKFHVSYEPVVPTTGVSAAVEYRVRCAAQSGAPHQQGDSAVTRVFDFDWDGDVDYVDFEYGFEPRYGQCKNANVTSEQCAEIDYNYDGRIAIDDFEAFRGRYAGN